MRNLVAVQDAIHPEPTKNTQEEIIAELSERVATQIAESLL
jgi:hypothetical protein